VDSEQWAVSSAPIPGHFLTILHAEGVTEGSQGKSRFVGTPPLDRHHKYPQPERATEYYDYYEEIGGGTD